MNETLIGVICVIIILSSMIALVWDGFILPNSWGYSWLLDDFLPRLKFWKEK